MCVRIVGQHHYVLEHSVPAVGTLNAEGLPGHGGESCGGWRRLWGSLIRGKESWSGWGEGGRRGGLH
jgi:hypothetical protein